MDGRRKRTWKTKDTYGGSWSEDNKKALKYEGGLTNTMMEGGRLMPKAATACLKRQIRKNM